jgi:hypothetical protein
MRRRYGSRTGLGTPTCTGCCFSAGFAAPLSAAVERATEAEADAIGVSGEIFRREANRERRREEAAGEEGFNGMSPWRGTVVVVEVARFMRPLNACVRRAATAVGEPVTARDCAVGICVGESG